MTSRALGVRDNMMLDDEQLKQICVVRLAGGEGEWQEHQVMMGFAPAAQAAAKQLVLFTETLTRSCRVVSCDE